MPISRLEARVYVHATESREKVLRALYNIFPDDVKDKIIIEENSFEGHYGNPIIVLTARIDDSNAAKRAFKYMLSRMRPTDIRYLEDSLEDRVDKSGSMYLRISKQEAYLGDISLFESDDVIRVVIHFQGNRRKALSEYREMLKGESNASRPQG